MQESIYFNDKDVLAKNAPIQCLNKNGKETLVESTPVDQSYT